MSIWFALLVPLIAAFIMLKWFRKHLAWWEVVVPLVACILFIAIFKFTVEKIQVTDTEYHGALIVEARYYEYWETYVHKTCTRSVACGTDSKGRTKYCTETYDCSYCDEHPARWTVVNSLGEEFSISKEHYSALMARWKSVPRFVELNRDINRVWSCGKDGDMYSIKWDGNPLTAEASTTERFYENRVQAAHSSFDFPIVSKQDVKDYKLHEYPEVKRYIQYSVLGTERVKWMTASEASYFQQWSLYLNGLLGPTKHARIYYLLFVDQQQETAFMQEAYWDGGNDNELVICIGLNSSDRKLNWVKPFTWSPERKIIPDMREDIMQSRVFNVDSIVHATKTNVEMEWKRKDFKEFSYITVDPPTWAHWVTWIMTILISFGLCYWAVVNDYVADSENSLKTIRTRNWRYL